MKEGDEMTNKEAIELLTEVDELATENGEDGDGFVALKIAIEALKREDHDGCDGCEHEPKDDFQFPCIICKQNFVDMYEPMPEHDREWIIRCIKRDGFVKTDRGDKANQIILEALKADTVEVVRCKDCKWYKNACTFSAADPFEQAPMAENDYCSWGERSEE